MNTILKLEQEYQDFKKECSDKAAELFIKFGMLDNENKKRILYEVNKALLNTNVDLLAFLKVLEAL